MGDVPVTPPRVPYVDPTANVIALVSAGEKKAAELAEAAEKLTDEKIAGVRRALDSVEKSFERSLEKEADRIDKNRVLDRDANDRAANRLAEDVRGLANTTAITADTLRSQNAQSYSLLADRVTKLELVISKGEGKQAFVDPALTQLLEEVKSLRESRSTSTGQGIGRRELWALIGSGILLALALWSKFGG